MSSKSQEILFLDSGMNQDDDERYVGLGDSPYRLHCLVGEEGSNGVITNMKGNHLAEFKLDKSNCYQVNGSYYNATTRKAYYFVFSQPWNFSGSDDYEYDNHLLEFNEDTLEIVNIFTDTANFFGLQLEYPVKDMDMLGDNLYFNPRISEPKMVNVVMAKNYMDYNDYDSLEGYVYGNKVKYFGGVFLANTTVPIGQTPCTHPAKWDRIGDAYQDNTDLTSAFDSEFHYAFNVIRHIPVYRPTISYGSDAEKNSNNVLGKVFRFAHRYRYFDDTYSLFSAYSDVSLPQYGELWNGEVADATTTNNYIKVQIGLHSPALIKSIDIIFQEIGMKWKRAKLINREEQELLDDVLYTYNFYNNDTAYEVIDPTLMNEPFDSVPQTAATQELINKNILSYGRCKEGFDNIPKDEIEVSLTPELIKIDIPILPNTVKRNNVSSGDITYLYNWLYFHYAQINLAPTFGGGVATNDQYSITLDGTNHVYTLVASDVVSAGALRTAIITFINNSFTAYPAWDEFGVVNITRVGGVPLVIETSVFYGVAVNGSEITKQGGFKPGAWHPFCQFYYDGAMRRCTAQTSKENIDMAGLTMDGTTVYVPMLNEVSPPLDDTGYKWNINWEVNHLPPSYARWWRWGYASNTLCSWFVQYVASAITVNAPFVEVDITPLQTLKDPTVGWNAFPQSNMSPYAWTKGDRIRFITEGGGTGLGNLVDGIYDFEIADFDDTTNILYVPQFAIGTIDVKSLIEIYTPKRSDTAPVFYEFGELMPIVTDSGGIAVHGGNSVENNQDFTLADPATGTFTEGDMYHILRTPSVPISTTTGYFHESQWYSDFYDSDDFDRGRIGVESDINQRELNIIRYSNQYFQNTRINGLSTFEAKNYKELSDIYGNIVSMVEVGTTLKVYMQKKSASILVGRQEYQDTEGNLTTASSDRVLGSVRYPENNFGTQWVESVTKNNRYVYGFDVYNATMWRDSANGIFPISGRYEQAGVSGDYKMSTYFKAKAVALLQSGIDYVKVISVWDEKYKLLYVTFKDLVNDDNNETIVYHESSNRWICFADLTKGGTYNVMLEPDYSIVQGFEGGLGYFFNDETRFAEFSFETSGAIIKNVFAELGLTFTLHAPSVQVDSGTGTVSLLSLTMTPQVPTAHVSEIHASVGYMSFSNLEYEVSDKQDVDITVVGGPSGTLTSKPAWVDVFETVHNTKISIGATILNGATIGISPSTMNTGAERWGYVTLTDNYGNSVSIEVHQLFSATDPTVDIQVAVTDPVQPLTLYATSGTATIGVASVDITFTPDISGLGYNTEYILYYVLTVNGVNNAVGSIPAVRDERANVKTLAMSSGAGAGDVIVVYLSYTGGIV
jgi:hypothetical protein